MNAKLLAALVLGVFPLPCSAVDLGVQGNVRTITERDIRQAMAESGARVDLKKFNDERIANAKSYARNLPTRQLPVAPETTLSWSDPSVTVQEDIQAPIKQTDGTWKWSILYKKGFKQNPLDTLRPATAMLFINGKDEEQVALAAELLKIGEAKVLIVEAGEGNVDKLSALYSRPVFYASEQMLGRFNISQVPALLFANEKMYHGYMGILAFGRPFKVSDARVWDGLAAEFTKWDKKNEKNPR